MNMPASQRRLMVAISSKSPRAEVLLKAAAELAAELQAEWFAVHVRQPPTLHYRMPATVHPVPQPDLDYAEHLGARVIVESMRGNVTGTLISFARTVGIHYFVTGRSGRSLFSLKWRPSLTEQLQRSLPSVVLIII